MTATLQTQLKPASTLMSSSFTAVRRGLLQRKCDCGGTPGPSGECEDCRKKPLSLPYHICLSELIYGAPLYKTRRTMLGLDAEP